MVDARWLRVCEELGILKTPVRPVGLTPGEGGGFLLLEKYPVRNRERPTFAILQACESGSDAGHRFAERPVDGHALADVVRRCLPSVPHDAGVISDLNGDTVRANDFGAALVQLRQGFQPATMVIPAISFGDTRAASAFLGVCVAIRAFARGYAPTDSFVVCASGDDGGRAALLVAAPN
jgi:3-oxoacyl-[acyl-carrier-protein] synthase-1